MLTRYVDSMTNGKRESVNDIWRSTFGDNIFDDLFGTYKKSEVRSYRVETNDVEMIASFDLPGVRPEDIDVSVIEQELTISYTLRGEKKSQNYTVQREYDASGAVAKLEHGLLEIRFPKLIKTKGKKIKIEVK